MKTFVAIALFSLFLLAVFFRYGSHGTSPVRASSPSSQIYIHGTPVCVTSEGETIVARVGECGNGESGPGDGRDESSPERAPFHGHPRMDLPPGHPPIDGDMFPDRQRRVLI